MPRRSIRSVVADLRTERRVGRPLVEKAVRKRIEPRHLAEPGRLGRLHAGNVPRLGRAPARRPARVEASVGSDPIEPGAERGAPLEALEALPRRQQRLLEGVLGILETSQHPVAMHVKLTAVGLGQLLERDGVPGPCPRNELVRHEPCVAHPPRGEIGGVSAQFRDVGVSASSTARTGPGRRRMTNLCGCERPRAERNE